MTLGGGVEALACRIGAFGLRNPQTPGIRSGSGRHRLDDRWPSRGRDSLRLGSRGLRRDGNRRRGNGRRSRGDGGPARRHGLCGGDRPRWHRLCHNGRRRRRHCPNRCPRTGRCILRRRQRSRVNSASGGVGLFRRWRGLLVLLSDAAVREGMIPIGTATAAEHGNQNQGRNITELHLLPPHFNVRISTRWPAIAAAAAMAGDIK